MQNPSNPKYNTTLKELLRFYPNIYWNLLPLCSHLDKTIFLLAGIQVALMQDPLSRCNASQELLISNWATTYKMSCSGIKCRFVSHLTSKRQDDWFIMITILQRITIKHVRYTTFPNIRHFVGAVQRITMCGNLLQWLHYIFRCGWHHGQLDFQLQHNCVYYKLKT